jgi:hypothetical protein
MGVDTKDSDDATNKFINATSKNESTYDSHLIHESFIDYVV